MAKLILMVGLPFSGKTTMAKRLEKQYEAIRLTPDEWHVKLFGQEFFRDKAKEKQIDFAICYCECPEEEIEERMNKRNNAPDNPYFYIPIEKYKEYEKVFQKPTSDEGELI